MDNQIIFSKESKSSKIAILILVAMFTSGFILWLFLYPVTSGSATFWAGAVLMAIPGYVAAESLGSWGLGSNFAKNLSGPAKIIFGVFWLLVCLIIFGLALRLLSSMVGA